MKFRKKGIIVEATEITHEWFTGPHPNPRHPVGLVIDPQSRTVEINTLEGTMVGNVGDWLITGVKGEMYPCKPDIFELSYERADKPAENAVLKAVSCAYDDCIAVAKDFTGQGSAVRELLEKHKEKALERLRRGTPVPKECPDCEHDKRWHSEQGCMLPACACRKSIGALKEAS